MKKTLLTSALFLLTIFALSFSAAKVEACDRSEISLDSVVVGAGYMDIFIAMNVGGGITGSSKGAAAATNTFAFAFYSSDSITAVSFTASLTGDSTGGFNPGADMGPNFGANFAIGYIDTGTPFTCVSSTASCGNLHTDTKQVFFRIDALPDSVRLLGIEGAGNPFAGCYPDADMLLDFTILPVEWASFDATPEAQGVALDWNTAIEINNDRFLVQRSTDGSEFETLAEVDAIGNSSAFNNYKYFDSNPLDGTNFYRIVQVDIDGASSASEVLNIKFSVSDGLFWNEVGPNPVHETLKMSFNSGKAQSLKLQVVDLQGRVIRQQEINALQGANTTQLDLNGEASGFYYLRISSPTQRIDQKILKM